MKTYEEILPELSTAHAQLIESLSAKGMSYSGSIMKDGERLLELKSEYNDIVLHSVSGKVELFTEFRDTSKPSDVGYHVWTLKSEAITAEIDWLIRDITAITGDN